jgi:HEXXH motif-containing protein
VMLPSLGAAVVEGETALVRASHGAAEVRSGTHRTAVPTDPHSDAPGWLGLRRIQVGTHEVLIDDLDPFRLPSSGDLTARLNEADLARLVSSLREAWPVLEDYHPRIAAELREAVTVIVPLISRRGGEISSSSSATFGAVGLSQPADPYSCAATFAHEIQHLKMSALLDIAPLTLPDDGQRFYAPWREDPRPIGGLLQGAYAFLGVSGFWRTQRLHADGSLRMEAETEFARWRTASMLAVQTLLASGCLTDAGTELVEGMAQTLHPWQNEPVSREALDASEALADSHLARWARDNRRRPA